MITHRGRLHNTKDLTENLITHLVSERGFRSADACKRYFRNFFGEVPLKGKNVLDIGCGTGLLSLYSACRGANKVIGLEPQAAGSYHHNILDFRQMIRFFDLKQVDAVASTIQDYNSNGTLFDLVLSRSSINHLEEEACIVLKKSEAARNRYLGIFKKINSLMNPGGIVIITDRSRYNLFGHLGLKNPVASKIDWKVHQSPQCWVQLLKESGFVRPKIDWLVLTPLESLGIFAKNRIAAYFLTSHFRLVMEKS